MDSNFSIRLSEIINYTLNIFQKRKKNHEYSFSKQHLVVKRKITGCWDNFKSKLIIIKEQLMQMNIKNNSLLL